MNKKDLIILGGGSAGITVAARAKLSGEFSSIAIVEPAEFHYYQPLWTLVGNGQLPKEDTRKLMSKVIPKGVEWIQASVTKLDPENNRIETDLGEYTYTNLVVATGILPDLSRVEGLRESMNKNGVCSVYNYDSAEYCFKKVEKLESGNLIFTMPMGLLKCGGAPQKIMWLTDDYLRRKGIRDKFNIYFYKEGQGIFGVEKYKKVLDEIVAARNISPKYHEELIKIDFKNSKATFRNNQNEQSHEIDFSLLHVVPHFKTHGFIVNSSLSNANGEVDVDKFTLQSVKFKNVYSLGDCSSCPTGKTGAAIRKQAPIMLANMISQRKNEEPKRKYNGYTACPILTQHNKVMLCEFDYDGNPAESFPFNQAKERYSMYLFKRYLLPFIYWKLMLKGRA